MTTVSTVGSKAQGVSFKEAGVSQGGKVGVRKRLLLLESPQRKQGYLGQAGVCYDVIKFMNRLSTFLESMATGWGWVKTEPHEMCARCFRYVISFPANLSPSTL